MPTLAQDPTESLFAVRKAGNASMSLPSPHKAKAPPLQSPELCTGSRRGSVAGTPFGRSDAPIAASLLPPAMDWGEWQGVYSLLAADSLHRVDFLAPSPRTRSQRKITMQRGTSRPRIPMQGASAPRGSTGPSMVGGVTARRERQPDNDRAARKARAKATADR